MALAKRIIPCLDVDNGRVVKGVNFVDIRDAGDPVAINTAAIFNPELVKDAAEYYGSQCIVVAIDAKKTSKEGEPDRWELFTHGGRKETGIDAVEWAKKMEAYGAGELLVTSMDKDGTKSGFNLPLTKAIVDSVNIRQMPY